MLSEFDSVFKDESDDKLLSDFESENDKLLEQTQLQLRAWTLYMQLEVIRIEEGAVISANSDLITEIMELLNKISD